MPFGKYKGQTLDSIPEGYLQWILENVEVRPYLENAIEERLGIQRREEQKVRVVVLDPHPLFLETLNRWQKEVTMRWHPDRPGGNLMVMSALNDCVDRLKKSLKLLTAAKK